MPRKKLELEKLEKELESLEKLLARREALQIPRDPVEFCIKILKFTPTPYQQRFLRDQSKRIVLCWSRQSGKSHSIAARAIWFALTHPKTLTLIVAPCLTPDVLIITDRGLLKAKDVKIGDLVFTNRGRWREVVDKIIKPYQGVIYRFKTKDGEVKVTPEHHLYVEFKGEKCWMTAKELYERLRRKEKIMSISPNQPFK